MPANPHRPPERLYKRIAWFVIIYLASLAAFAALVYALRGLVSR